MNNKLTDVGAQVSCEDMDYIQLIRDYLTERGYGLTLTIARTIEELPLCEKVQLVAWMEAQEFPSKHCTYVRKICGEQENGQA